MPKNVEVKARVDDVEALVANAERLSGGDGPVLLQQEDTFFVTPTGRLKLRKFPADSDMPAELIYYERDDTAGPKESRYSIGRCSTSRGDDMDATLAMALGVRGVVKKSRRLYMVDQTRVHVDAVEGLGNYMELEVVMRDDQSLEEGMEIAANLMEGLGVPEENLVHGAYLDLIEAADAGGASAAVPAAASSATS